MLFGNTCFSLANESRWLQSNCLLTHHQQVLKTLAAINCRQLKKTYNAESHQVLIPAKGNPCSFWLDFPFIISTDEIKSCRRLILHVALLRPFLPGCCCGLIGAAKRAPLLASEWGYYSKPPLRVYFIIDGGSSAAKLNQACLPLIRDRVSGLRWADCSPLNWPGIWYTASVPRADHVPCQAE